MNRTILSHLAIVCFLTLSCGNTYESNGSLQTTSPSRIILSFSKWCALWHLQCPQGAPEDFPRSGRPWSRDRWQTLAATTKAIIESSGEVTLTQNELDDKDLRDISTMLGTTPLLDQLNAHFRASKLKQINIAHGAVSFAQRDASQVSTSSGLTVKLEQTASLAISDDLKVRIKGLQIAKR